VSNASLLPPVSSIAQVSHVPNLLGAPTMPNVPNLPNLLGAPTVPDAPTALGEPYTMQTGCKINAYLRITGRLPSGYHTLDTIFVPLSEPFDTLCFSSSPNPLSEPTVPIGDDICGLRVLCDTPGINLSDNTLTKAYAAYAATTGFAPALTVRLQKGVPQGAGLGGGSANAAGLLQFLQSHAPKPLSQDAIGALALTVGGDVPFFLRNHPCHASGFGEILTPIDLAIATGLSLPWHGVLVMPQVHVSTIWAYGAWDECQSRGIVRVYDECIGARDLTSSGKQGKERSSSVQWFENSFEVPVFSRYPELALLKRELICSGARVALLSGSGASLFALFTTSQGAKATCERMMKKNIDVRTFCIV